MEIKRRVLFFLVFFSCYLVFSLAFVSAYQVGGAFGSGNSKQIHAKFIMEPVLKIIDDLKPMSCDSSGYVTFRAYVENVAEFSIASSEAMIEDASDAGNPKYYDVTSALSCTPRTGLISNQEITCRLSVKELLNKFDCPLAKTGNMFYLSFVIAYGDTEAKVADSRNIVITGSGVRPGMEISFDSSQPAPDINCRTGSEIDVPVVIHNAETLFGDISWSFSANGTSSSAMDCTKILSRTEEGRTDIYTCALSIPGTIFSDCEQGSEVVVAINAETSDYRLSDNFTTSLSSAELSLSLKLSQIEKLECQIIDEQGTCVPKEPQQNVTATITGNVPEKLKVFESRYKIGDDDMATLLCNRQGNNRYQCMVFITLDKLGPSQKSETKSKDRNLTVFFDVKYMNYYRNISASTGVTLEGKVINDILNTQNVLKQNKGFLEWIANNKLQKALVTATRILNLLNMCCIGVSFGTQAIEKEGGKEVANRAFKKAFSDAIIAFLKQGLKKIILGTAQSAFAKIMTVIGNFGPKVLNCIAKEGAKDIETESQNLQKFENKTTIPPEDLKVPTLMDTIEKHMSKCTAEAFWQTLKDTIFGILCAIGVIVLIVLTWGTATGPMKAVCHFIEIIGIILNVLLIAITVLMMVNTFLVATKSMALARERINLQLNATQIVGDYNGAFSQTIESMTMDMAVNDRLMNLTYASYGMETVKLMFNSSRTGLLAEGDEMCLGDSITIDYDLEKLNLTGNFRPELLITGPHSKTLYFDNLKGTYGPKQTDELLGIDIPAKENPTDEYIFRLQYADKNLYYKLIYVNHQCG